jgi:hypothetical protein
MLVRDLTQLRLEAGLAYLADVQLNRFRERGFIKSARNLHSIAEDREAVSARHFSRELSN